MMYSYSVASVVLVHTNCRCQSIKSGLSLSPHIRSLSQLCAMRPFTLLLLPFLMGVCDVEGSSDFRVCAFNVQSFGDSKSQKSNVMLTLTRVRQRWMDLAFVGVNWIGPKLLWGVNGVRQMFLFFCLNETSVVHISNISKVEICVPTLFSSPAIFWCVKTEKQNQHLTPTPHLQHQTLRRRYENNISKINKR